MLQADNSETDAEIERIKNEIELEQKSKQTIGEGRRSGPHLLVLVIFAQNTIQIMFMNLVFSGWLP